MDWLGRIRSGVYKVILRRIVVVIMVILVIKIVRRCEIKNFGSDVLKRC